MNIELTNEEIICDRCEDLRSNSDDYFPIEEE